MWIFWIAWINQSWVGVIRAHTIANWINRHRKINTSLFILDFFLWCHNYTNYKLILHRNNSFPRFEFQPPIFQRRDWFYPNLNCILSKIPNLNCILSSPISEIHIFHIHIPSSIPCCSYSSLLLFVASYPLYFWNESEKNHNEISYDNRLKCARA